MYYNFLVKIPENTGKISYNKRKNATYVEYTYDRVYNPEKKYNIAKRTTIGKVSEEDDTVMYPNPSFEKFFPDVLLPEENTEVFRSSCVKVGTYIVIKKIIKDYKLFDHLTSWDERGKGLLLDCAAYSIITESNAAQHYPEYAYNHPLMTPKHTIYSDSTISRFFSEISFDDRIDFLNSWNKNTNPNDPIYISYDSTNKHCKAGNIEMVEYGHPKTDVGAPIFNYAVAYDLYNQKPLLYEDYPGSITDVSQLHDLVEKFKGYGYKNLAFVLDRGYFSRENIHFMKSCGYDYLIMVKGKASFVNKLILERKGTFETDRSNAIKAYRTYGITINTKLYQEDNENCYFHLYHKSSRESAERIKLKNALERMEETMDKAKGKEGKLPKAFEHYYELTYHGSKFYGYKERKDVIEKELKLCGYFAIVTSKNMSAEEALVLYKNRDASEKLFCSDKSFPGNSSLRVAGNNALESKVFVEFIALIIRNKIYTLLKNRMAEMAKKPNFMTVPGAIRELEKIELIRQPGGNYKLDHAITATQKTILGAFGIDGDIMRTKALAVGRELENSEIPEKEKEETYGTYEDYEIN